MFQMNKTLLKRPCSDSLHAEARFLRESCFMVVDSNTHTGSLKRSYFLFYMYHLTTRVRRLAPPIMISYACF